MAGTEEISHRNLDGYGAPTIQWSRNVAAAGRPG